MKIVYISDLHIDITENNKKLIPFLYNYILNNKPDIFIIAGDLANTNNEVHNFLNQFKNLNLLKIYVPGNHDLWIESKHQLKKGFDSSYKYEIKLNEICIDNNFKYPIFDPIILNECAIIGSVGWYDYSIRDKRLDDIYSINDYNIGTFGNKYWCDVKNSIWLENRDNENWKIRSKKLNNLKIFDKIYNQFKNIIEKIPSNITKIIIIIHMSPFEKCIIPKNEPDPFDAYEGSVEFGNYIKSRLPNKEIVFITGHRHKKLELTINEKIKVYRSPIGYLDYQIDDFQKLLEEKIGYLEL